MATRKEPPTQSVLRKLFFLDFEGHLRWAGNRDSQGIREGDSAIIPGQDGYGHVNMFGKKWKAHILVYVYANGPIPPDTEVDHRDRDRMNNTPENLRAIPKELNMVNREGWNKAGDRGVTKLPSGRFKANITVDKKTRHLGTYDTQDEAAEAYKLAAKTLYEHLGVLDDE